MLFIASVVAVHAKFRKRMEGLPSTVPSFQKSARDAIERFDKTGESGPHSPNGGLLAPILNHCVECDIDFELRYQGGRYMLWRR